MCTFSTKHLTAVNEGFKCACDGTSIQVVHDLMIDTTGMNGMNV